MTLPPGSSGRLAALAIALLCASGASAASATGAAGAEKPADSSDAASIFPGTSSKQPISIDAEKLVYYDKEHKAIYTGNVVVVQGDTKMTCTAMTVFLEHAPTQGAGPTPAAPAQGADHAPAQGAKQAPDGQSGPAADAGVKRLEAKGPVTVISKTQIATGDNGSYDKTEGKVYLIGHVTLSDGQNVTKGDKLTYDLKTGEATVDTSGKASRVHGQFVPKSNADAAKTGADAAKTGGDAAKTGADTAKAK
jgi:lipopolysaccharide export system protein LptA